MVSASVYSLVSKDFIGAHPIKKTDYDGIIKVRWTTDVLFAILIWLMWAAMSYVGYTGLVNGDPYRLIAPVDSKGNACGYEGSQYATNKYLYTVSTEQSLGVCVEGCPETDSSLTSTNLKDYYCLPNSAVPSDLTAFATYIQNSCFLSGHFSISKGFTDGCFCNIKRKTTSVFHRCIFSDSSIRSQYSSQTIPEYFSLFAADIYTAKDIIFGFGFGCSIILSFIWSHLLAHKWLGYLMTWTSLIGILTTMIAMVVIAQRTTATWSREDPPIHSSDEILSLNIFSWFALALAIAFFCMMVFLYRQINLSVKVLALTSQCINSMKIIYFCPLINLIAFAIFMVPCVIYMLYIASGATLSPVTATVSSVPHVIVGYIYDPAPISESRFFYLWLCLLVTMNWIGGISAISIAIACATWYFTKEKTILNINSFTVIQAYYTTIRYHWGTAAIGGFLIAIVQFIRWYLLYMHKHYETIIGAHMVMKYVCCCIQCCLWCLDCCLKYISKQAYIQTAIHGSSFMTGGKDAFFIIARNIFRVGAVTVVGGLSLFIGKVFIISATVAASFFYLDSQYALDLNGIAGPLIFIGFIAWFTSSMFMDVYHMSLDTIFMCYLSDEEAHDGTAQYCDEDFKTFVTEHGQIEPGYMGTSADEGKVKPTVV